VTIRSVCRDHDGTALITLGDDLEEEIGTELVDREIPHFVAKR
jgi:hypothetical protein